MKACILIPVLLLGGCSTMSTQPEAPTSPSVLAGYPFAPAALRIHPLTHIEPGSEKAGPTAARPQVILHFELLDKFGDSVKGLGTLKVELYRPGAGMNPGMETQELSWEVPGMDQAEPNTRRFDTATRTYRVPLFAPGWVPEVTAKGGWVKVRVMLTVSGADGERNIEDEYVIQG